MVCPPNLLDANLMTHASLADEVVAFFPVQLLGADIDCCSPSPLLNLDKSASLMLRHLRGVVRRPPPFLCVTRSCDMCAASRTTTSNVRSG
jgi:hypothetical protein